MCIRDRHNHLSGYKGLANKMEIQLCDKFDKHFKPIGNHTQYNESDKNNTTQQYQPIKFNNLLGIDHAKLN